MTKAKKTAPKAVRPPGETLTLTITIPAPAVPLFRAMAALKAAQSPSHRRPTLAEHERGIREFIKNPPLTIEAVAAHAVVRWIVSAEATEIMDKCINRLLGTTEP